MTEIESSFICYLHGEEPELIERSMACHIVNDEEAPTEPDPENSIRSSKNIYMDGDFYPGASQQTATQPLYMDAEGMRGRQLAYINTPLAALEDTSCYIEGFTYESLAPKGAMRFTSLQQQYVQVPDVKQYDFLHSFTINLWVKPRTDALFTKQGIVVKEGVIETWVHNSGNSFGMRVNIAGVWYQALTLSFAANRWYMLSIRYDGSTLRFYMNGVEFHSINASGSVTENNLPWYFGRYPSLNTYSDIDLCDVQLWNYALPVGEIPAMYTAPARRACLHAYLHSDEPLEVTGTKRSYISSDLTPGNPLSVTSVQWCEFGLNEVGKTIEAFIVAGGEGTREFDTRLVTDARSYRSWDSIIMVRGNQTRIEELQMGSVVYPITREARRKVRIPTSYDPLTITSSAECWMLSYNTFPLLSRLCYIPTVNFTVGRKAAYIPGTFESINDSHACMVVNNQLPAPVQRAYIAGLFVFKHPVSTRAYVNSFADFHTGLKRLHLHGRINVVGSKLAYIPAPAFLTGRKTAFIMSTVQDTPINEQQLYIQGNVGIRRSRSAYMFGHFSLTDSQNAFIPALPTIDDAVNCFVHSENPVKTKQNALIRGFGQFTDTQSLYIKAETFSDDTQPSYVRGAQSLRRIQWLHLRGPAMTPLSDTQSMYISNNNPVGTKYAFIVSAPMDFQPAYIVNTGVRTNIKFSYIAA